jgi:hypothetical protein
MMRAIGLAVSLALLACDSAAGPAVPVTFAGVSAGGEHTCAIVAGGAAYCWGDGAASQLGDGQYGASALPRRVTLQPSVLSLDTGFRHTCALTVDQDLFCWGWNVRGQLGNASTIDQALPISVAPELRFQQVSAGWFHTCALSAAADAYCWGGNSQGQLGTGTAADELVPQRVLGDLKFSAVSAGGFHTCGVTTGRALYCWGLNYEGQLGNGSVVSERSPVRVASDVNYAHVSAGYTHTCALDTTGRPWCWGSNSRGELGVAFASPPGLPGSMTPAAVLDVPAGFIDIDAGLTFTCAVAGGGQGWCWGLGQDGQLGTGAFVSWVVRQPVADVRDFVTISTGDGTHACGRTRQGVILCWGRGDSGQLGNGSAPTSPLPVRVPGVTRS